MIECRKSKVSYEKLDARAKRAGNDVAALAMRVDDAKKDLGMKQQELQGLCLQ